MELGEIASRKDHAALAGKVVVKGFFWMSKSGHYERADLLSSLWPIAATASITPLTSLRAISFGCPSTMRWMSSDFDIVLAIFVTQH
jgi:hypothetical protein